MIVSPDAVTEPHGLARLREYLAERYAATLKIQYTGLPGTVPLVLRNGAWVEDTDPGAAGALYRHVSDAFVRGASLF